MEREIELSDYSNSFMFLKVVVWEVLNIKEGFLAESQIPGEESLYHYFKNRRRQHAGIVLQGLVL